MKFGRTQLIAGSLLVCLLTATIGRIEPANAAPSSDVGVASPAELVLNGSFEDVSGTNALLPDQWAAKKLPVTDGRVCGSDVNTGTCALHLTIAKSKKQVTFTRRIDGNPNEAITFSLWSKPQAATDAKLTAVVTFVYWNNKKLITTVPVPNGTADWAKTEASITPLQAYKQITVSIQGAGKLGGELWLDDISLSVAPSPSGWMPPQNAQDWIDNPVHGAVVEIGFGGPDEYEDPAYPSVDSFRLLRELGVHVVVIEFQYVWTIFPPYGPAEDQFDRVTAALNNARDAGLYVVLANRNGPGVNAMYPGIMDQDVITTIYENTPAGDAARQAYRDMLTDLVNRYKDRPEVIAWEPIIEPVPDYFLYHEESPYPQGSAAWNPIAESFINTIRAADPDRPIIIEPVNWGGYDAFINFVKFSDDNVIYSLHNYEPYSYTDQERGPYKRYPGKIDGEYVDKTVLDGYLTPVDDFQALHDVPIYVGEWGGVRWMPGMGTYIADQMSLYNERGWSWTIYAWYDAEWDQQGYMPALGPNRKKPVYNPYNPVMAPITADWAAQP